MRNTSKIAITRVIKTQLHDIKRQYVILKFIYIYMKPIMGDTSWPLKKKKKKNIGRSRSIIRSIIIIIIDFIELQVYPG